MGKTTEDGYGWQHQQLRRALLAALVPGTACCRCGLPMDLTQSLDLDHNDDRTGYNGLAHSRCNRAAGGRKSRRKQPSELPRTFTSRDW